MSTDITINDLANATITDIHHWFNEGRTTAAHLVLLYLERIARFDRSGPTINAILEINPDAYQTAQALDQERRLRGPRSPLHGVPVVVKDNVATADKMHTSAGSLAMADVYAPQDSFVVERLRGAGAIILGKTNLTEWANFMTENMPNGYSSRGGQVLNPYGPGQFDTGGSSSGSGAAIAAGLAAFAIGTETSGSILSPASQHSLVGIKPTVGLISRFGIVPISFSQDTAGPMCRTVTDAAIALGALTGVDPRDPATGSSEGLYSVDYTIGLTPNALQGVRIGVPDKGFWDHLKDWQRPLLEQALQDLKRLGAVVVSPADIPEIEEIRDFTVLVHEFKVALNAYLSWLQDRSVVASLSDVIAFNEANAEQCLKHGQTIMLKSEETSGTLTDPEYLRARGRDLKLARDQGIDRAMAEHRLDALVFPNNFGAGIAAKAGHPSITVPCGYSPEGEPVGLTFTATAYSEADLIRWTYAYEQGTLHRRAPALAD
jgi:amidase